MRRSGGMDEGQRVQQGGEGGGAGGRRGEGRGQESEI